ncbi:hypothetical protein FACS189415_1400 [Bacteroidia bacterium]|nr:hypothetical protein FACS189415_1400 [Bacteroidia bacterium]
MPSDIYEWIALAMRYWFIAIILFILWRTIDNAVEEYRYERILHRALGQRFFGFLDIVASPQPALVGERIGIRRNTLLGGAKRCDVRLPGKQMPPVVAVMEIRKGQPILVPRGNVPVAVNGRKADVPVLLEHNDIIAGGQGSGTKLRVVLDIDATQWGAQEDASAPEAKKRARRR